ncbi:MAG: DUF2971 domain-containing protein [Desulfobacteraceae bacterium]|nr:DUF2971 domain-containing protein [Desulfobacteraceae bacterium]
MVPIYLYKFEKISEQALRNLKNAQIFFNTPSSFNDPFDCSVLEASVVLEPEDYISIFKHYINEKGIVLDCDIRNISDIPEKYKNQIFTGLQQSLKQKQYQWLFETGCTCFSERKDYILMWSHYADDHKGFCLEFNTSFKPFQKAIKVEYSDTFPSVNSTKLIAENPEFDKETLSPILTKYKCWCYEKEWRIFHREPNKPYGYDVDALNAVYFGSAADDTDIEIVCLLLQGQSKNTKFYKAREDTSKYSLHFDEFFYTPYIEHNK